MVTTKQTNEHAVKVTRNTKITQGKKYVRSQKYVRSKKERGDVSNRVHGQSKYTTSCWGKSTKAGKRASERSSHEEDVNLLDGDSTEHSDLLLETDNLARSEVVQARVVGVVHVVVDGWERKVMSDGIHR